MLTHAYGALSRFQANQNQKSLDSEDPQREGVKTSDTTTRAPDLAKSRMGHLGDSGSYLFQRVSTGTGLTEGTRTQICITPTLVGVESNLARTQPLRNFIKHVGSVWPTHDLKGVGKVMTPVIVAMSSHSRRTMLFINQRGATKLRGTHLRFAAFSDKEKTRLDGFAMAPTQLYGTLPQYQGSTSRLWDG